MYFTLEINKQLACAMRAAAEFKVEVEKVIECVCTDEDSPISDEQDEYMAMSDSICDMIVQIGRSMGVLLSEIALDKVRKENPALNKANQITN